MNSSLSLSSVGKKVYCEACWLMRPIKGTLTGIVMEVVIIQTPHGCYGIKATDIRKMEFLTQGELFNEVSAT
jgi:hypothetical protein